MKVRRQKSWQDFQLLWNGNTGYGSKLHMKKKKHLGIKIELGAM